MRWKDLPILIKVPIYILMLFLAFMTLAPFMYFVSLSLSSYADTYEIFLLPRGINLGNYKTAWEDVNIAVHYRNSLYVTLLGLLVNLSVGSMAAFAMARFRFPAREPIYYMFLAGLILSGETMLVPLFLNARQFNLLNEWFTLPIIYATLGLPFTIFVLRSAFETIHRDILDAASMDGCSALQLYRHIMLPLSRASLLAVALFQFVWFWDEFILAISLVTNNSLRTLTAGLSRLYGQYFVDYPVLAAALVMTIIPVVVLYLFTQRKMIRGMTMGALK